MSGDGVYQMAAAQTGLQSGQLWMSSDSGVSFTNQRIAATPGVWSSLSASYSGKYLTAQSQPVVQPNQTGLASYSWSQQGVTYTASASTEVSGGVGYMAYKGFNNTSSNSCWAATGTYSATTGLYEGSVSTMIQSGIGAILGEWLQLQVSIPLVFQSYRFGSNIPNQLPKNYYIVGSNDGSTWFPIQYVSMITNPIINGFVDGTTNLIINYTGTQTVQGEVTGSGVTTSYATSTQSYLYFRIVTTSTWSGATCAIGEWHCNFLGGSITPNLSGLAAASWSQSGVSWTASASSILDASWQAYKVFDNSVTSGGTDRWICGNNTYNTTTGAYSGAVQTVIQGVGTILGEWLQLQTSIPMVLQSYTFVAGDVPASRMPKVYYIVGSNDGSTWYPLQYVSMTTNPFTTALTAATTNLIMNYTGTQTIQGNQAGSGTTTAYAPHVTLAWLYFRMVVTTFYGGGLQVVLDIGEFRPFFTAGQNSTTSTPLTGYSYSGSSWVPLLQTGNSVNEFSTNQLALSESGQYSLFTMNALPYVRLTMDNTNVDSNRRLTPATGVGSVTYSTSIVKVGTHSAFFNNTAGSTTPSVYLNYIVPPALSATPSLTISCWAYPTALPASNDAFPIGFNNGAILAGTNLIIRANGTCGFGINGNFSNVSVTSSIAIAANNWVHLVGTIAGGVASLYVNGTLQGTALTYSIIPALQSNGGTVTNLFIGALHTSYGAFAGYVDDVRIYTTGLNATEVTALYNNPALTHSVGVSSSYLPITSYRLPALSGINTPVVDTAVSQTGQFMVLVTSGVTNNVYYSRDYGATFTGLTIGSTAMVSCAISHDGSYLTVSNGTTTYRLNSNSTGYSLAVGSQAGQLNQASNAIAIGNRAGQVNQSANSIVLNATGSAVNAASAGFYVAPISAPSGLNMELLGYGADSQVMRTGVIVSPGMNNIYNLMTLNVGSALSNPSIGRSLTTGQPHAADKRDTLSFGRYDGEASTYLGFPFPGEFLGIKCVVDTAVNCGYGNYNNQTYLGFHTWGNSYSGSREVMRIRGDGNVGIGTTQPSNTLHVNGTSKLGAIGTPFVSVVAFLATLGMGTTGVNTFTITYPTTYSNAVKLVINVTLHDGGAYTDTFVHTIRSITTSSFVLNVIRVDVASSWSLSLQAQVVVYELT